MKKGYSNYISVLLTGVLTLSFAFAIDSLNKNRITLKSDGIHKVELNQLQNSFQDTESRDLCSDSFVA